MESFGLFSLVIGGFILLSMLRTIYRGMAIHNPWAGLVLAPLGGRFAKAGSAAGSGRI